MKASHVIMAAGLLLPLAGFAKEEKEKEEEKSLTLDQVPAQVAAAIKTAAGAEKVKIKAEKEDGVDAFEAKWSVGGHKHEITVKPDGAVISEEEAIALESAPAPVQAAIKSLASAGELEVVEKVTEHAAAGAVTIYEAAFESKEGKLEVKFDATGKETARETEKKDKKEEKDDHEDGEEDDDGEDEGGEN